MAGVRPPGRDGFEVAIICALPLEYDAVSLVFDEFWDEEGDQYGRATGDSNNYTTGRIGKYNVVLALLPHIGKANAASAAASIRTSYGALRLALLVGICGGVPRASSDDDDGILLGDVVISKTIVQHDFGRQYPNHFMRKNTAEDNLGKSNKDIRSLLAAFETNLVLERLQQRTAHFLKQLQANAARRKHQKHSYAYPGAAEDKLFEPSYRHKHRVSPKCICSDCYGRFDPVCDDALKSSCQELGCDERYLVVRERLQKRQQLERENSDEAQEPAIHVGPVASGDAVMKSGEDRDGVAKKEGVIAFEMEGAGVWEEVPCIVVKGVSDYADCHKSKKWQDFAAATAASASKAILERYVQTDKTRERLIEEAPPQQRHWIVPFGRNMDFVGRESILQQLLKRIPPSANEDDCQRTAIEGLGGVGKTQIALEVAFRLRDNHPGCSVFWVPAVDTTSFENAYREIGQRLGVAGIDEHKANVKTLVKAALSREDAGGWLLVIDNADDLKLLYGEAGMTAAETATGRVDYLPLARFLPFSRKGSILFTTRTRSAAVKLAGRNIITVTAMDANDAYKLLETSLADRSMKADEESATRLLNLLTNLPLAIRQASAYMNEQQMSTAKYLQRYESSSKTMINLLSKDFEEDARYGSIKNPVATTWLISFEHISRNPLAAQYLRFMCFLAEKEIPASLLPPADDELEADEAIGALKAYAFITPREGQDSFDMHRLVRLAMRIWLNNEGQLQECRASVVRRLTEAYPTPKHENRDVWMKYLPHAQSALESQEGPAHERGESDLHFKVAASYSMLGKYQEAERMYWQTLKLREKVLGKNHPLTLNSMNNLAFALQHQGKYKQAEQIYRQTLELREKVLGEDHYLTLSSMENLASVLRDEGKYEEAEQIYQQTLELNKRVFGKEHPEVSTGINFAILLDKQGKPEEAEKIGRETLKLQEETLGREHPSVLAAVNNLGEALRHQGKYDEAEQIHRQTLELKEKVLGKEHPWVFDSMNNLALVLHDQGKYEEAEQIHRQTLELKERVLGKTHPRTLDSMNNLGETLRYRGKYEEAEQIHRQEYALIGKVLGKEHPDTFDSMSNLALVLQSQGKYEEAEAMHRQTLALREKVLGKGHPDTEKSRNNLADCLRGKESGE